MKIVLRKVFMHHDISIGEIQRYQRDIWELHKHEWTPMKPQFAKDFILYMIEEIGETVAIVKKKGHKKIMEDPKTREHFIEEMGDILMYYADVLNRFEITPAEFAKIYRKKIQSNLARDFHQDHENAK